MNMHIFSDIVKKLKKLNKYCRRFGTIKGINIVISIHFSKKKLIEISLPELKYPIKLRSKTSDLPTFESIFLYEEYKFPIDFQPKLVIDGGAHVGYSSIFFANKFPEAKIVAIEPETSNYELLKENCCNYKNIELLNVGIWNKSTYLKIKDVDTGTSGFIVEEVSSNEDFSLRAMTIKEIIKLSDLSEIGILKLNVEGSEKAIFSSGYEDWIDKVKIMIISLHDWIMPGCSETFYNVINKYNFIEFKKRGDTIFVKH